MLQDPFGRTIEYLRISVTDRCDLRCSYCMPRGFRDFEEPEHWLSFGEIARLTRVFARLGLKRVRLTGGEPLLRRNLPVLAARIAATPGIEDLSLSTNATQLDRHAQALYRSGVRRLNVSLDSLRRERIAAICHRDVLKDVLAGLEAARASGFSPIKINMVVQQGVNDDEIEDMVRYCIERGFILRLIETMPVGAAGRAAVFADLQPIQQRLRERYRLVDGMVPGGGPARYLSTADGSFSVGFITPMSQHFCAGCNRVRLAVDGTLYLCLGQEDRVELRGLLRSESDDTGLEQALRDAVARKPERHDFNAAPTKIVRLMSSTGG